MAMRGSHASAQRSGRWRLALKCAAVFAAIGLAVLVYDFVRGYDRQKASDVEAEIAAALPTGTTETDINTYLDQQGLSHGTFVSPSNDYDLNAHGVRPGTLIIGAGIHQEASIFWYSKIDFAVIFVLDDSRRLERFFVTQRDYGPS